jgi:hypothetical protein
MNKFFTKNTLSNSEICVKVSLSENLLISMVPKGFVVHVFESKLKTLLWRFSFAYFTILTFLYLMHTLKIQQTYYDVHSHRISLWKEEKNHTSLYACCVDYSIYFISPISHIWNDIIYRNFILNPILMIFFYGLIVLRLSVVVAQCQCITIFLHPLSHSIKRKKNILQIYEK